MELERRAGRWLGRGRGDGRGGRAEIPEESSASADLFKKPFRFHASGHVILSRPDWAQE